MALPLSTLAKLLDIADTSDLPDVTLSGVNSLDKAGEGELSFLSNPKYAPQLAITNATVVLVRSEYAEFQSPAHLLCVDNPNLAFSTATEALGLMRPVPKAGISPRATIAEGIHLGENITMQPGVFVDEGSSIGSNTILYANVSVGINLTIGENCIIYPNASIMDGSVIGNNVIINAGSVIGSDGFGFDIESADNTKIPQVGNVVIEDCVEIGANVTIDRARFGSTKICTGTKIDNLVQIAHNVIVGPYSIIAAQSGFAGSTEIGMGVVAGGATSFSGHLKVHDRTMFAGRSCITKNITTPGVYGGFPAKPINSWRKEIANLSSLGKMRKSLKALKERIANLEQNNITKDA